METEYKAAIYCRLSREDLKNGKKDVSSSIENQQAILEDYVYKNGWTTYKVYIDDDVTGTTFNRPGFQDMMSDIENGKINCVITKDLSRLGRNYLEAGRHRELFNEYRVRYIAINDNHDSLNDNDYNISTPIIEMMNEVYAADISRKVRSTKKLMAEQGKFANSRAPYGYMKSPENKHKLIIDENVADTVKRIYQLFLQGNSGRTIADTFNKEDMQTPNVYYYSSINKPIPYKNQSHKWGSGTIMNILKNPAYIGNMASGKRKTKSYKDKHIEKLNPELWIVTENTHEAIIEKSVWEEVQGIIQKKNHLGLMRSSNGEISLFSGIIKCADCGTKMTYNRKYRKTYIDEYYRCGKYTNKGTDACTAHTIRHELVYNAVLNDLREFALLAYNDESKLAEQLISDNTAHSLKEISKMEKQLKEKEFRLKENDKFSQSLYEEKIKGDITEDFFKRMLSTYEAERLTLSKEITSLSNEQNKLKSTQKDVSAWIRKIKKCLKLETLTREIAVELIESISISAVYEKDGEKQQDINITYKFENISLQEKRVG